jgi:hypothetical protein
VSGRLQADLRGASRQYIDAANTLHTPGRTVLLSATVDF